MKAVVADGLDAGAVAALGEICDEVVVDPGLQGEALAEACVGAEVLVVRSTKVGAAVFDRARQLSLVVRAGAGVNTIDVDAAAARGIFVANCPGKNAVAVAELAVGLLLSLDRQIPDNVASFRGGRWDKARYSKASGLAGRTVGIVGLGQIGQAFLTRIAAFDVNVVGWSRALTDVGARALGIERAATLDELFRRSDAVSLHLALNDDTRGIVGRELLGAMRPGAMLVNTARSGLVDQAALLEAVEQRGLRVGLDVIDDEPPTSSGELASALQGPTGVYVTHHIGASTGQAQAAVAAEVVRIVRAYADRGEVPNCVNLRARPDLTHQLMVRHEDRTGVLAEVLAEVSRHGLNVDEMENLVFRGEQAACCFIQLSTPAAEGLVEALEAQPHVLSATLHS